MSYEIERIAKGGGTTMANPVLFAEQLAYPGNEAGVVVVSAAGINGLLGHDMKLTSRLDDYSQSAFDEPPYEHEIQAQVADIGRLMDPLAINRPIQAVVERVPSDLRDWTQQAAPVMALGERWSAEMFAGYTGREFVDACELIRFDRSGQLDIVQTRACIRRQLGRDGQFVVPGFYGADQDGRIHLLPRGGSDVTAALIAEALQAGSYHNWSDVDGFMTTDPRQVLTARLVPEITRREVREMSLGCELLHPNAIRYAGEATPIHMRNTFGAPNARGTVIVPNRRWRERPFVGVVARTGLVELGLHQYGMNEMVGSTNNAFNILADRGIPYSHAATSEDDLSIVFDQAYERNLPPDLQGLERPDSTAQLCPISALRIVGEGLIGATKARRAVKRRVEAAFDVHDIAEIGVTDAPRTASITYLIEPHQAMDEMLNVVHEAVFGC